MTRLPLLRAAGRLVRPTPAAEKLTALEGSVKEPAAPDEAVVTHDFLPR